MVYTGLLQFGGREVINGGRTSAYVANALPTLQMAGCTDCEDLHLALGDKPYTSPLVDQPEWFDPDNPDTWDFYGLYPLSFEGFEDATTDASVTQFIGDGGSVSPPRRATRSMRITGLLIGLTPAAVSAGMTWLRQVLRPARCRDGLDCTGDHLCYLVACPPLCEDAPTLDDQHHDPYRECESGVVIEALGQCTFPYERHLYQATVVDGPTIVEEFDPSCGAMVRVEFTVVSGVPSPYGTAVHVSSGPTGSLVSVPNQTCTPDPTTGYLLLRENLAPNPAMQDPGGWTVSDANVTLIRDATLNRRPGIVSARATRTALEPATPTSVETNLVTNPSMETGTGTVAVRTNLATVPQGNTYVTTTGTNLGWHNGRWFGQSPGAGTYTSVTGATDGPLPGITSYARKTWTVAPPNAGDSGFETNSWTGVVAGATYTVSGWIRCSVAHTNVGWEANFSDVAGQMYRNIQSTFTVTAGVWTRFSAAFTAPPVGVTSGKFILDVDGPPIPTVGETIDVTGLLVEQVGTPGATVQRTNWCVNASFEKSALHWSPNNATLQSVTDATAFIGGAYGRLTATTLATALALNGGPANVVTVVAGEGFAYSVYVRGTVGRTVSLRITWTGATATTSTTTAIASATAWQRLTFTGTVPAGATQARPDVVVAATGIQVGDVVDVDAFLYERGTQTVGTFFDGSSSGSATAEFAWTGAAWNTTSVQRTASTGWLQDYFDGAIRPALRTNLVVNPGSRVNTTGWNGYAGPSGTATSSTVADGPIAGTQAFRMTWTVAPSGGGGSYFRPATGTLILPNTTYTWSVYVRPSRTQTMYARIEWNASVGGASLGQAQGSSVVCPAGQWTRLSATGSTSNTTARYGTLTAYGAAAQQVGDVIDFSGGLLEQVGTLGDYFDGATSQLSGFGAAWSGTANASASYIYDADLSVVWTGTANASTSNLNGVGVANQGPGTSTNMARVQSTRWAANGSRSLRVIPRAVTVNDTYVEFAQNGISGFPAIGALVGKTFTVTATGHLDTPQTGTLSTSARRVVAIAVTPGGNVTAQSAALPNTAGATGRVTATLTVPADATFVTIRGYSGAAAGGGDVWWDSVVIVEGSNFYGDDYWDGSSVSTSPDVVYAWTGAVNASTSTRTTFVVRPQIARIELLGAYGSGATQTLAVRNDKLTHVVSAYVWASVPTTFQLEGQSINAAGAANGPARVSQPPLTVAAGSWQRVWLQIEVPDGTVGIRAALNGRTADGSTAVVGSSIAVADVMLEEDYGAPLAYFDGDMSWPADDISIGWTGARGRSSSTMTQRVEIARPILDPDCPPVPSPPRPPVIDTACIDDPDVYQRYTVEVHADAVPLWSDAVPIIRIYSAQGQPIRQLRVRFYSNPFEVPADELDPCNFCGEFIVSYLPSASLLTLDGIAQSASIVGIGATVASPASHLLYGSGGGPMVWPQLTCGIRYDMVVDIAPDSAGLVQVDLCIAGRE